MVNQHLSNRAGIFAALLLLAPVQLQAAGWDFQWQPAAAVSEMPLLPVTAEVMISPQAQQGLVLPFAVQIAAVYQQSGQQVQRGEPLLKLRGAMLQSFTERLEIAQHHASAASSRLQNNQQRYAAGDILRETWLEWQHQAHQTALEYADLQQQQRLLDNWQAKLSGDGTTLAATEPGTVVLATALNVGAVFAAGTELLQLQQAQQAQLEFRLPPALQVVAVSTAACRLPVPWASAQVQQQYRLHRSGALTPDCHLSAGQRLSVQPWQATAGFKVPRQALVQTADGDAVIVGPEQPALLPVRVIGRSGDWVYLQAALDGRQVATQDVAALKGQLQGMGGAE